MEPNDTLLTATQTNISFNQFGKFSFSGTIGDNPNVDDQNDVDLFQLDVAADTGISFDIDARSIDSSLDSILRVFDSAGNELAVNDDADGLDSFISFLAPEDGTYFVGISSFSNFNYNPTVAGSGDSSGSTGNYNLEISTLSVDFSGLGGGAQLLKDINPGSSEYDDSPLGSAPLNFTEFDGKLFFVAENETNGNELWVSDGTAEGTQLLKDISPENVYGYPDNLTEFDGQLFFTANDGTLGQ